MSELVYNLLIHADELDGGLWAEVEGLPGCFAQGEDLGELVEATTEAIRLCAELPDDADIGVACHLAPGSTWQAVTQAGLEASR